MSNQPSLPRQPNLPVCAAEPRARIDALVATARRRFAGLLERHLGDGISPDAYARYLSFQYHLTRGVQRYFLLAAGHSSLRPHRRLRRFLVDFAYEEELHYLVAGNDLAAMGRAVEPEPLDVTLWHAYFERITPTRPFVRLGAACILENLAGGEASAHVAKALSAPFLDRTTTKFLTLHRHEHVPHGDQIMDALFNEALEPESTLDLEHGAQTGMVLYLRMAEWALDPEALAHEADARAAGDGGDPCDDDEAQGELDAFSMEDLDVRP